VVIRDRLETLALLTVPDTDLTHMAALCMSELAVLYYPVILTMRDRLKRVEAAAAACQVPV
jgi:hypothetical protein